MVRVTLVTNNPKKVILAEETKTVKQILEDNDVTYGNAATMLDGAVLNAGEINRTLKDLGVVDKVVISVLAHKDNAAKAVIMGSACVITSGLTAEQIKRYKQFHPEALTMYDDDDEPVFMIGYDEDTPGSINGNGALFGPACDAEGHATITIGLDPACEDKEKEVYEKLGRALLHLDDIEAQLIEGIAKLDEEEAEIKSKITRV